VAKHRKKSTEIAKKSTEIVKKSTEIAKRGSHADLVEKLHYSRFSDMSSKMAALVAFVLGQDWVRTRNGGLIHSVSTTSDGFLIARVVDDDGNYGHDMMLGDVEDLWRNFAGLINAAGLTQAERQEFQRLFMLKFAVQRLNGLGRRSHLWEF